jgi:uncharacterized membrane protein YphA (DoxX/SURF4 family)
MKDQKYNLPVALIWFCRIAVGLLFIFSGLIKANDPLGFSYKLEEYFEVFHLLFLSSYALYFAIFLCALEMILGFALLVGWRAVRGNLGLIITDRFLWLSDLLLSLFQGSANLRLLWRCYPAYAVAIVQ